MEKKLSQLFDFQRFSGNKRLSSIIADVESRYSASLSDDDLGFVSAAGDVTIPTMHPDVLPGRHDIPTDTGESKL